jgi:hypothetical protein
MKDNEGRSLAGFTEEKFHGTKILGKSIRDIFAGVSLNRTRLTFVILKLHDGIIKRDIHPSGH